MSPWAATTRAKLAADCSNLAAIVAAGVEAEVGGGVVDVGDRMAARDAHAPLHVLPAPADEACVERLGFEDVAADQQVGGEDVLFRRPASHLDRHAVAAAAPCARCRRRWPANARRLVEREAAERHRRIVRRDQLQPARQEVVGVRQHVGVEEQQVARRAPRRPAGCGRRRGLRWRPGAGSRRAGRARAPRRRPAPPARSSREPSSSTTISAGSVGAGRAPPAAARDRRRKNGISTERRGAASCPGGVLDQVARRSCAILARRIPHGLPRAAAQARRRRARRPPGA